MSSNHMLPIVLQAATPSGKPSVTALPPTATVADLQLIVRKAGGVSKKSACALTIDGCTPSSTATIGELFAACKSADGSLHVTYAIEVTMGCCYSAGSNPDSGSSGSGATTTVPESSGGSSSLNLGSLSGAA